MAFASILIVLIEIMVNIGLLFNVFMDPKDVSYLDLEKECFESKTLGSGCIIWEDIALSVK